MRRRVSLSVLGLVAALSGCDGGGGGGNDRDPDFAISAAATSVSLIQGESVTATIEVSASDDFDEAITVSVTGLPLGVTADSLTIPAGGISGALVLHAAATAVQGGPVSLTVTGSTPELTRDATLSLLVRGPAGTLDQTFGTGDGWLLQDFANLNDVANVVLPLADGKILVGGAAGAASTTDFALTRYLADGSLDSTFGSGTGRVTIDMGGYDSILTLALQADGKILAAGRAYDDFAVARFTADGTLDIGFGSGTGKYYQAIGADSEVRSISIQSDGKIVLVGYASIAGDADFVLVRLDTSGELDSDFGASGSRTLNFPGNTTDIACGSALVAADAILVAGSVAGNYAFARFTANGTLDTSFGEAADPKGYLVTYLAGGDEAKAFQVLAGGSMLIAGSTDADFAVARFLPDGTIDQSFAGGQGRRVIDFAAGSADELGGMAVLGDGSIVLAGRTFAADYDLALARLTPGGEPDLTFGTSGTGRMTTDFGAGHDSANAIGVDATGRLVVTGAAATNTDGDDQLLTRFWP